MEIITESTDRYTHYYVKAEDVPAYLDQKIYIGLATPNWGYDIHTGAYGELKNETKLGFYRPYFTANRTAFLPSDIIVPTSEVDNFMSLAGQWYLDEYVKYVDNL